MTKSAFPTSMVDLVGVGLNCSDTLILLEAFPARGSKVEYHFGDETFALGGQTATAVVACQTWGLATRYVGKLGQDETAQRHHGEFSRLGVDARIVTAAGASSPHHFILVDGGERTILGLSDDRLLLQPGECDREWVVNARTLLVDGFETAAATEAARWARSAGVAVIADFDEVYPGIDGLMENVDHLIVSRDFPSSFTSEPNLKDALRLMHGRFGFRVTAATLGEYGVLAWDGSAFHSRPGYQVPVIDTTGSGDIFHAAYIYGLLQGWPLEQQLDFACAAAAMNCTGIGARGGIHSVHAIEQLRTTGSRHQTAYSEALGRK